MNRLLALLEEVLAARDGNASLDAKLDAIISQLVSVNDTLSGRLDTVDGKTAVVVATEADLPAEGVVGRMYVVLAAAPLNKPKLFTYKETGYQKLGGGGDIQQITKLNITATAQAPYLVEITTESPPDFAVDAPTVLYLDGTINDLVQTQCAFDNGDASSFAPNDMVVFDGQMKLKTTDTLAFASQGALGAGTLYKATMDTTKYKKITRIEVV